MPTFNFDTDYSSDPVLQKMLMGGATDEADADTAALAARRGVVQQLGDRNLASSVLGADDPTLGAISDDPDSRRRRSRGSSAPTGRR
jgi:hypothetical protein